MGNVDCYPMPKQSKILIAGLGNPGQTYQETRHNLGFRVLDALIQATEPTARFKDHSRFSGELATFTRDQRAYILLKPGRFMNRSGAVINQVLNYYKIKTTALWVVYDDLALPAGTIRLRGDGSAGGHNGVQSIIETTGTAKFTRLRLGIGPLPPKFAAADFVLNRFSADELPVVKKMIAESVTALNFLMDHSLTATMNKCN